MTSHKKIIVITGASQGLGRAFSETLGGPGVHLVLTALHRETLDPVVLALSKRGVSCDARAFDVTNVKEVQSFVGWILEARGRIDVLLNNAGWAAPKQLIEKVSDADYERYMATNLHSVFYFMREVIPLMKKQGSGLIVNISSRAGHGGHGGLAAYSASKFAVLGLTQSAGWELRGTDVSCVSVSPGGINTPMRAKLFGQEDAVKQQSPEQVASLVKQIVDGTLTVPNGGDISIVRGEISEISDPLGDALKR